MLDVEHAPNHRARAVERLERAGLGPVMARACAHRVLRPTWTEIVALHLSVANGATKRQNGPLLHQPFRVESLAMVTQGVTTNNANWLVAWLQTTFPADGGASSVDRPLWPTRNDGAGGQYISPSNIGAAVCVGTIIRNVPGQLVLEVANNEAVSRNYTGLVTVTFLAEPAEYPAPAPA